MRLPRDLGGRELAALLRQLGYEVVRQTGSHIRLTAVANGREVHITIPEHSPLKIGTLAGILSEIAAQNGVTRREIESQLFQ